MMLQKTIDRFASDQWDEICESYPKLVHHNVPKILLNNRLRTTAGLSYDCGGYIELAAKFFPNNKAAMLTLILPHELAHSANALLFPEWHNSTKHGHDPKWAEIMHSMGLLAHRYHTLKV